MVHIHKKDLLYRFLIKSMQLYVTYNNYMRAYIMSMYTHVFSLL